mmetsp:Transcript_52550/g.122917  ORF Transcript_52550/g.122917 Transcript_52550/m.122917 type:complete len:181 (+) Transcript_52550:243-785(+)
MPVDDLSVSQQLQDFWKGDHKCHGDGTACQTIEDLFPPRTCGKLGDDKSDIGVFRYQSACPVAKIVLTCLVFATTLSLHALWMNVRVLQGYVPARTAGAATAAATMFFLFGVVVYGGGVVEVAKDIDFGPHASTDADTSFSIACVAVGLGFFAILIDCLVAVPKKDGPGTYSALHGYHTA